MDVIDRSEFWNIRFLNEIVFILKGFFSRLVFFFSQSFIIVTCFREWKLTCS